MKYNVDKLVDEILNRRNNQQTSSISRNNQEIDPDELLNEYLKIRVPNYKQIDVGCLGYVRILMSYSLCNAIYDYSLCDAMYDYKNQKTVWKKQSENIFECFTNICKKYKEIFINVNGMHIPIFDNKTTIEKMQEVIDLHNIHHRKFDFLLTTPKIR